VQYLFDQVVPGLLNQTGGLCIRQTNANTPLPPGFQVPPRPGGSSPPA
jgi:hypothetical protein